MATTSKETVTVACKLPNGLKLRLFEMIEHDEPVMGGGYRTVKIARKVGETITLNGCAAPFGVTKHLVGGYALTLGVPADFMAAWMDQNKGSPLIESKQIVVHVKDTEGAAREHAAVRSGLEPLSPKGDPRAPKGITKSDATAEAA